MPGDRDPQRPRRARSRTIDPSDARAEEHASMAAPHALVTGGAGFVGSHLCDRLLAEGWAVECVDSLLTGSTANLASARSNDRFRFRQADVSRGLEADGPVDWVFHLASLASPRDYLRHPLDTLEVGALGTFNCLRLAREKGAGVFLASTSEVYGDPKVHPQPETYWGNVNPVGPRSVYDESKRFAEASVMAHRRVYGIPIRIVRIFNTFGPRMRPTDGRAVPTFIHQALRGDPITVHGDGGQTRTLCYIDDLIEGMWRTIEADVDGPINLGGNEEISMGELAEMIRALVGSDAPVIHEERPIDDPEVRRPDLRLARELLDWQPRVPLRDGLARTIDWMRAAIPADDRGADRAEPATD
jgi:dTDP-glucose 4,6-dehydratase